METNTGDPKVAVDFFKWGISLPGKAVTLAVIWNHGSGTRRDRHLPARVPRQDDGRTPHHTIGHRRRHGWCITAALSRAVMGAPSSRAP